MSEKRTTEEVEPTNAPSPLKKKVKTDEDHETNGDASATVDEGTETEQNGTAVEKEAKPDTAASWTPPPFGSLCWVQIPAVDVKRAKEFYTAALNFTFKPTPEGYSEENIAMFSFNNTGEALSGGLCKVEEYSKPSSGTLLYFMVDKIEDAMEKIKAAGGKERSEKKEEGKHGLLQIFEDTEGNAHGIYQVKM